MVKHQKFLKYYDHGCRLTTSMRLNLANQSLANTAGTIQFENFERTTQKFEVCLETAKQL